MDCNEDKAIHCMMCLDPPHNAVRLQCWIKHKDGSSTRNEKCKTFLCGTSRRRGNCINKYLAYKRKKDHYKYPIARWSEDVGGLEFLDERSMTSNWKLLKCEYCDGAVRGAEVMPTYREYYNSLFKDCDFFNGKCEFEGNHEMIEAHITQVHAPPLTQEDEDIWEVG